MKDPNKVKELILSQVDLAEVMLGYGIQFVFHPGHADEVQYRCQFHGKGDTKPSARFYRQTQSCYCWVCRKSWNVIDFIMEKEMLGYYQALGYITTKYKIDLSSIPDDPEFKEEKEKVSENRMRMSGIHKSLIRMRGRVPFDKYNILCVYFLTTRYRSIMDEDISASLTKLEEKISTVETAKVESCP